MSELIDPLSAKFTFKNYYNSLKSIGKQTTSTTEMPTDLKEKVSKFIEWINTEGIWYKDITYPAFFTSPEGFTYPGILANEKIGPNQIIIKVPSEMILSTQAAYKSELNGLFKLHAEIYSPVSAAWEDYVLITYIMYEMAKGASSKWFRMFELWPRSVDVFYVWKDSELMEIQAQRIIKDALHENKCLRQSWENMVKVLNNYPLAFPQKFANYDNYLWLWALLASRIFNTYISTTAFTPHAEFVNHENVSTHYKTCLESEVDKLEKKVLFDEVSSGVDSDFDVDERYSKPLDKNDGILPCIEIKNNSEFNPDVELAKIANLIKSRSFNKEEEKALSKIESKFMHDQKHVQVLKTDHQVYEKGSQIYMSYGNHGSMYFVGKYGFCYPYNKYDYATVEVNQINNYKNPLQLASTFKKVFKYKDKEPIEEKGFKVYYQRLSTKLILFAKIVLGYEYDKIEMFESFTLECAALTEAIKLLENEIKSFPTTYEEDEMLLEGAKGKSRLFFAIKARMNVKNILKHQIYLINLAKEILTKLSTKKIQLLQEAKGSILEATSYETKDSSFKVKLNRRMIHHYFKKIGCSLM
jgi:hypothetical protein